MITLQLSAEQELRLKEGVANRDEAAVREVLLQTIDSTVDSILWPRRQPEPEIRRALLRELVNEFPDLPPLSHEAVSRPEIYDDP